jgi:phage-related protein
MLQIKPVVFVGSSRTALAGFPVDARRTAGFQLDQVQRGIEPVDAKPMSSVGLGAFEIRVRDSQGAFRVICVAKYPEAVYVLHAFRKKSRRTSRLDIELAKARYRELQRNRE